MWSVLLVHSALAADLRVGADQSLLWEPPEPVAFIDAPQDAVSIRGTWTIALHLRGRRVGTWPMEVHFESGAVETLDLEVVDGAYSPQAERTETLGMGSVLVLPAVGWGVQVRGSRGLDTMCRKAPRAW